MSVKSEAVKFMSAYKRSFTAWSDCVEKIRLLREKQMAAGSPSLTGLPRAGSNIDLSDYVVRLEMQVKECEERREQARKQMQTIKTIIEDVYDNTDRAILSYRYIDFLQFADIARELGLSKTTIARRHENAVVRAYTRYSNKYGVSIVRNCDR